jgi:hypothetical protein
VTLEDVKAKTGAPFEVGPTQRSTTA